MIAENANATRDRNINPKLVAGNMPPYLRTKVTIKATKTIAENVLRNQASQLIPGLKPIALIV